MNFVRSLIATSLLLVSSVLASDAGAVYHSDIATWTVAGLHLGMTSDEALAVATQRGLLGNAPPFIVSYPCESERQAMIRASQLRAGDFGSVVAHGQCPYTIQPAFGSPPLYSVTLSFIEDFPAHPGVMRLAAIEMSGPAKTDAAIHDFYAKLQQKYGQPSEHVVYQGQIVRNLPQNVLQNNAVLYEARAFPEHRLLYSASPQRDYSLMAPGVVLLGTTNVGSARILYSDGDAIMRHMTAIVRNEQAQHAGGMPL